MTQTQRQAMAPHFFPCVQKEKTILKINLSILLTMILCLVTSQTHAAFVSLSDLRYGADSITLDTETGLRWLDVPISLNRSYNDVAAQFGAGGDFEGYRFATPSEVTSPHYS